MRRTIVSGTLGVAALVAAFAWAASSGTVAQAAREVFVTNWPEIQKVDGEVAIRGPVRLASFSQTDHLIVAPVDPSATTRLVDGGTLDVDGFAHVVVGIAGQTKGDVGRPGTVGAFLVPDVETVRNAFFERGEMLFTLHVEAPGVSSASPYFASRQARYEVAFPRYRVYLYNTSDKSAEVELYAYRTN